MLFKIIKASGYTQSQLAKDLKIDRKTLWNWNTNEHKIPVGKVVQISKILRVNLEMLAHSFAGNRSAYRLLFIKKY